jgi:hypothetical protein
MDAVRQADVATARETSTGGDAMTDMDVELLIRVVTALAGGSLLATPAIRLWRWNSALSLRGAILLIVAGVSLLIMASSRTGFLETQGLQIQLTELEEKVDRVSSLAATAETTAHDTSTLQQRTSTLQQRTSTLQQRVESLQTKINALEGLGKDVAEAQKGQAARLETLLSSLYFQQVTPQGQAAVYIDANKLRDLQSP